MQLLLRCASLHQTGNDLQEDPTTCGSEPLNRIWDHWTSVLPTRGRRQPLENTGCGYAQGEYAMKTEREREKWAGWARHIGQLVRLRFHPEHRWNMHSNITQSRHFFSKATALTDHWQTDSWLTFVGRFPGMARTMREHDGLPVRSSWTLASTHQPCTDNSTDRTMGHFIFSLKLKLQTKVRILIQPRGPVLNQTSD